MEAELRLDALKDRLDRLAQRARDTGAPPLAHQSRGRDLKPNCAGSARVSISLRSFLAIPSRR
jgi:hypothetical protein